MARFVCEDDGNYRISLEQSENDVLVRLNGEVVAQFDCESGTLSVKTVLAEVYNVNTVVETIQA